MSETTNKTAAAKRKSTAAATKTVAKGATEQATETKPDATVTGAATNQANETKSNESTGTASTAGHAADSGIEGKQTDGDLNKESTSADGAGADLGANAAGDDGSQNSASSSGAVINGATNSASPATLGKRFKGAFVAVAKTDAGFWRSGVKFKRLEKTLVLVLDEDESGIDDVEIVGYESAQVVCLSAEKAKRIYNEKNLVVTEIDIDELKVK